jgi:hypothetical protein
MSDKEVAISTEAVVATGAGRKRQKLTANSFMEAAMHSGEDTKHVTHEDVPHLTIATMPQALASLTKADEGRTVATLAHSRMSSDTYQTQHITSLQD